MLLVSLPFNSFQFLVDSSQRVLEDVSGDLQIVRAQLPAFLNSTSSVALQC